MFVNRKRVIPGLLAVGIAGGLLAPLAAPASVVEVDPSTGRVSVTISGDQAHSFSFIPAISVNGRYVAFSSFASDLVPGDTNGTYDLFVRDRVAGTTERVSVSNSGAQANADPNDGSGGFAMSADGRYVAFDSYASNLVPGDTNGRSDVFVRDRVAGTTLRVSVSRNGAQADSFSFSPAISAHGRYVAFVSNASNLVPEDTNGDNDVFVRDLAAGTTQRVSVSSSGDETNGFVQSPAISAHGRYVAFGSGASNLVPEDTNEGPDVFVRDRLAGTTQRVSVSSSGAQSEDAVGGLGIAISAHGRYVVFDSYASDLVQGDTEGWKDVFVRDRLAGTTERVSVSSSGAQANFHSEEPAISPHGRYVGFFSFAANLVPADTNGFYDIFVRDRVAGTTRRVSVSSSGAQANNHSTSRPAISAHGRYVAFASDATNLVPGDTNDSSDVFVRDRGSR